MSNVISEEVAERSLNSPNNLVNILYEKFNKGGRKKGSLELSPSLRAIAGGMASIGTAKSAAKALGISPIVSHLAKKALVNTNGKTHVDVETKEKLDDIKGGIVRSAVATIQDVYKLLPAKLGDVKARDLASIAKDSASIIEKLSEKNTLNGVTVIIQSPGVKDINDFEVIDITPVQESV
jgi:hypothetical protein